VSGSAPVRLGLRENAAQFSLLVAINAFVGAMVGLERSTLPLIGRDDFGLGSSAAVLSFIVAFGLAKSFTNLGAGALAERAGRRRLLLLGWVFALPVPLLIAVAPSWGWVIAANVLLGVNQGLAWSMTVVMKIDLVGPRRRGLALGLNEAAGYGGVAFAAAASGWLASELAPRDVLAAGGAGIAVVALLLTAVFVRDTAGHVRLEQRRGEHGLDESPPPLREVFPDASYRQPALRSCSQAGLVNNLNDALAWGLVPLFLVAHGASAAEVGLVAGLYPGVWGVGQILAGQWSDRIGRKPLIVAGMLTQATALGLLVASDGGVGLAALAAVVLGVGTALVYPTLMAAISDAVSPVARAPTVGVYRFWRDMGYVAGGLLAGLAADAVGYGGAIALVAALTAASGIWVAVDLPERRRPGETPGLLARENFESLGGDKLGEPLQVERPASLAPDPFADPFPAVAVAVDVAVLELHARALRCLGYEPHLDLARPLVVGLDLPLLIQVPAEDDPVRRLVGEHARPAALAAVDATVDDMAADTRLEHGLGELDSEDVVLGRLEPAEVLGEDREGPLDRRLDDDR
jgi:MFS family permease